MLDRRTFLGALASGCLAGLAVGRARAAAAKKLVIVQFGGGARSRETIDDPKHEHIPHLWHQLIPAGTLFDNLRVEGPVVHPNSTAALFTGHWEYADFDWAQPPRHPTIFELYRRATGSPDTAAWAFVYASILARTGESKTLGTRFAANVVVPPTIPRATAEEFDGWLARAKATGSPEAEAAALRRAAGLVRKTSRFDLQGLRSPDARAFVEERIALWKRAGQASTSHDEFLAESAIACLRRFAPEVLAVCFGEMDCAHYGSWSRYVEAIARTDALTFRLWHAVEQLPAYRGCTRFIVVPDHGRELERPDGQATSTTATSTRTPALTRAAGASSCWCWGRERSRAGGSRRPSRSPPWPRPASTTSACARATALRQRRGSSGKCLPRSPRTSGQRQCDPGGELVIAGPPQAWWCHPPRRRPGRPCPASCPRSLW
jgi:hypothetical protein